MIDFFTEYNLDDSGLGEVWRKPPTIRICYSSPRFYVGKKFEFKPFIS